MQMGKSINSPCSILKRSLSFCSKNHKRILSERDKVCSSYSKSDRSWILPHFGEKSQSCIESFHFNSFLQSFHDNE